MLPPVPFGLNRHHIDFPGTIHIEPEVFIAFCLNVTKSVAYHGFEKILIVNGHGSNTPLVDLVARKTVLETHSLCIAVNYFTLGVEAFQQVKETPVMAHADEFETSLYLHLAPERVRMDLAVADNDVVGRYMTSDSTTPFVRFSDYWARWTKVGVHGDPTAATPRPSPCSRRQGIAVATEGTRPRQRSHARDIEHAGKGLTEQTIAACDGRMRTPMQFGQASRRGRRAANSREVIRLRPQ